MYYVFGNIIFANATGNARRQHQNRRNTAVTLIEQAADIRGLVGMPAQGYPAGAVAYDFQERIPGTKTYRPRVALMFAYGHEDPDVIDLAYTDIAAYVQNADWADGIFGTCTD